MTGCEAELCDYWNGFGCVCEALGIEPQGECDHDWMLRPESDTWECLICGAER